MSGVFEHLDEVLCRVIGLRDSLLADPDAADRAERLAVVFATEAQVWSQLYELSSLRLVWRAALAAESGARENAAKWARRAAQLEQAGVLPPQSWAAGQVGVPCLATLSTSATVGSARGSRR